MKIRGKEFRTDFISNYVHIKFAELQELVKKLPALGEEFIEIEKRYRTGALERSKYKANIEQFEKEKAELRDKIIEMRLDIVQEIVTGNNEQFDETWWLKRTSPDDLNEFMLYCVRKDLTGSKTSKKK